jgi:uncharacterized oligopeptide transporter (OPT) family protein
MNLKCRSCGSSIKVTAGASAPAEESLLSEDDVTVTSARFVVEGTTYAIAGVTSVGFQEDSTKRGVLVCFTVILALIGFAFLAVGMYYQSVIILLFAAVFGWLAWMVKPDYSVILTTAAGEIRAITSKDRAFIRRIVNALNDAIVLRK